jgi:hypothetical protein
MHVPEIRNRLHWLEHRRLPRVGIRLNRPVGRLMCHVLRILPGGRSCLNHPVGRLTRHMLWILSGKHNFANTKQTTRRQNHEYRSAEKTPLLRLIPSFMPKRQHPQSFLRNCYRYCKTNMFLLVKIGTGQANLCKDFPMAEFAVFLLRKHFNDYSE